jgi:hypothetical protein
MHEFASEAKQVKQFAAQPTTETWAFVGVKRMTERISASFDIYIFTKLLGLSGPGRISF